jgi:hypothetical protein
MTAAVQELSTVQDARNMIAEMCRSDDLAAYGDSLCGPRLHGSTTTGGLEELPADRELKPLIHPALKPGCQAYTVHAPELGGLVGVMSLKEALEANLPVRARIGRHDQPELYIDQPLATSEVVDYVTIILEEEAGRWVVSTWHPGNPVALFSPHASVKTHNG